MGCSRRDFLKLAGVVAGAPLVAAAEKIPAALAEFEPHSGDRADYTLTISTSPIEVAPHHAIPLTTYNRQFPGPLLRLREGREVAVEIINHTDTPEQLHWHGQKLPAAVDGAAEEGTPFIPARGRRRVVFTPRPAGFRFYHTHVHAGANLALGQYGGQVGPVYIEPEHEPGDYDQEVFLVLKEFEPSLSRGGDVTPDFLSPAARVPALVAEGERAMKASLARGMPHGYEVGYRTFTINGRMLGQGPPLRVKAGQRVLFHVLNGSATELRSLALPGHSFRVRALDGNPVPNPASVPVLWLGTGERISALVDMNHPGVWIMGDLDDDDRSHGMGVVVEYSGRSSPPAWSAPPPFRWSYARFARPSDAALAPDDALTMTFTKENAAAGGFNRWRINGVAYPSALAGAGGEVAPAQVHLHPGRRYRIHLRNASDDIHPIHLHRHSFELTNLAGEPTAGIMKDVVMLGGYQEAAIDFVADNPGLTLFHCHQQLHMDFGFKALFDYV